MTGSPGADDCAVYRLTDDVAVINTVDFFTPIVDDPYQFGAIAAANAMSDVYAVGGEVVVALNVCAFPEDLPVALEVEILRGGGEKVKEAGGVTGGGHTVKDKEPKYGLALTGIGHPDMLFSIRRAKPGDVLLLTKPLGVGLTTTALKGDVVEAEHLEEAVQSMMRLNRTAASIFRSCGVKACTDITGFGLLGHALDLAKESGVDITFSFACLPFVAGALGYAEESLFPGGACTNRQAYKDSVVFDGRLPESHQMALYTPETSGGLLASVDQAGAAAILKRCKEQKQFCRVVGEVHEGSGLVAVASPGKTGGHILKNTG